MRSFARGGCAALSLSLLVGALLTVSPTAVSAATVSAAWSAKIGGGGANGSATLQLSTSGTGSLALKLVKLPASTSLAVTLSKGTCSSVGATILTLPAIKTTSAGAAARSSTLTATQASAVTAATAGTGTMAIRIGSGSTAKCGLFAALAVQPYVAATITVGREPHGVAIAPSGVWVTNYYDNTLSRIDPATNAVLQTLPLKLSESAGPKAIASGDGSLWVTVTDFDASNNPLAGSLLRLDPASGAVQATIAVGRTPGDVVVTPTAVWVPAYADSTLARIDPATNTVVATIPVCTKPAGVASAFGAVWVSCYDGSLARIDPATNTVVTTIQTQASGAYVVASDTAIWMTNPGHVDAADGTVTRVDPGTNTVVASVTVGSGPMEIDYAGGSLWIGLYGAPTVVRVSATTNAVLAQITVASPVYAIAASDRSVWAALWSGSQSAESAKPSTTVTRINYAGVTPGPLMAAPPAAPTPSAPTTSPSPTASPSAAPAPTASPMTGGAVATDNTYFSFTLPPGWEFIPPQPGDDPSMAYYAGPGNLGMMAWSAPTSRTLEQVSADLIASNKAGLGAPEQTETVTMGGAPGRMLTYHGFFHGGDYYAYVLEAFCVHNGRVYQVVFVNSAGNETADHALVLSVLASFKFLT